MALDGWMDGWVGGWMVEPGERIAHSNQKQKGCWVIFLNGSQMTQKVNHRKYLGIWDKLPAGSNHLHGFLIHVDFPGLYLLSLVSSMIMYQKID